MRHLLALPLALAAGVARSQVPTTTFSFPTSTYGEREIDFKYGVATKKDEPTAQAASLGVGYGVTEWWFTEFYVKGSAKARDPRFDAIEWENKFQLTETGKYPIDVGFIAEFELPHDRTEGNEFRVRPAVPGRVRPRAGQLQPAAHEHHARGRRQRHLPSAISGRCRYRWTEALDFGAQGFGDMGRWNHLDPTDEQSHRLGPAASASRPRRRQAIVWNAAFLFGVTKASPDYNFRLQVEYEF